MLCRTSPQKGSSESNFYFNNDFVDDYDYYGDEDVEYFNAEYLFNEHYNDYYNDLIPVTVKQIPTPTTPVTPVIPVIPDTVNSASSVVSVDVDVDVNPDTINSKVAVPYEYTIDDGNSLTFRKVMPGDINHETDTKFRELESILERWAFKKSVPADDIKKIVSKFYPNGHKGLITIFLKIFPFLNEIVSYTLLDDHDENNYIGMEFIMELN